MTAGSIWEGPVPVRFFREKEMYGFVHFYTFGNVWRLSVRDWLMQSWRLRGLMMSSASCRPGEAIGVVLVHIPRLEN